MTVYAAVRLGHNFRVIRHSSSLLNLIDNSLTSISITRICCRPSYISYHVVRYLTHRITYVIFASQPDLNVSQTFCKEISCLAMNLLFFCSQGCWDSHSLGENESIPLPYPTVALPVLQFRHTHQPFRLLSFSTQASTPHIIRLTLISPFF